jgi:Holliday junction resolvase-like predicted endonuclease
MTKMYQGAKMEEIQAKRQSRKNRTARFWIQEYPIFPE